VSVFPVIVFRPESYSPLYENGRLLNTRTIVTS
jgi:hypothetical protein